MSSKIRIFSYLPNPRVWKSLITAKFANLDVEVIGDKPKNLANSNGFSHVTSCIAVLNP